MTERLWVDFNDIEDGEIETLTPNKWSPEVGQVVLAFDNDLEMAATVVWSNSTFTRVKLCEFCLRVRTS